MVLQQGNDFLCFVLRVLLSVCFQNCPRPIFNPRWMAGGVGQYELADRPQGDKMSCDLATLHDRRKPPPPPKCARRRGTQSWTIGRTAAMYSKRLGSALWG